MIRFQRIGRTNDPAFRIVVLEKERAAKSGATIEQLGTYNPKSKALTLDAERAKIWLANGAQPTDSIRNLFITKGVMEGKKVNALPHRTVQKLATPEAGKEGEEAAAAAPAAEGAVPAAPTEAEVAAEAEPAPTEEKAPEAPAEPEEKAEEAPAETPAA